MIISGHGSGQPWAAMRLDSRHAVSVFELEHARNSARRKTAAFGSWLEAQGILPKMSMALPMSSITICYVIVIRDSESFTASWSR